MTCKQLFFAEHSLVMLALGQLVLFFCSDLTLLSAEDRPNILWITSEDNGPHLGCYGDENATTPNLDALAKRSTTYLNAWSNAPVCGPARTTIITGMYPNSIGAQHMRSMVPLPQGVKLFPQYLRAAGYYCTNNRKEDYNIVKPDGVWDESSNQAHYKNREEDQPFFAVFNLTITHESQIRKRPHQQVHDPATVRVPAYHPDHPEVRKDWAQYHDKMTQMDARVGKILDQLDEAGLADDTIVFYYSDHGAGMPRSKRWPINQGLHVPMIVHIPKKFESLASADSKPGIKSKRLVSFVDLAPTILSLAGIEAQEFMQGKAFLGSREAQPREYIYGFRDRMDERYDMVRSIRNERYILVRNFSPHLPYGQHLHYQRQTPTDRIWKELFDAGQLNKHQAFFWKPKPVCEVYDLQNDPDEVNNLYDPLQPDKRWRDLYYELQNWMDEIRDVGYLPEAEMHRRAGTDSPYDMSWGQDNNSFEVIETVARFIESEDKVDLENTYPSTLLDRDSAVRFRGLQGVHRLGKEFYANHPGVRDSVLQLVTDESPSVAIAAAELVAKFETEKKSADAISRLIGFSNLNDHSVYICIEALNAVDRLDDLCRPMLAELKNLPVRHDKVHSRMKDLVARLLEKTLSDLE